MFFRSMALLVTLATLAVSVPVQAQSRSVDLRRSFSSTEIARLCAEVRGRRIDRGDSYGCVQASCTPRGDACSVQCRRGKCRVTAPPGRLAMLKESNGTASTASTSDYPLLRASLAPE